MSDTISNPTPSHWNVLKKIIKRLPANLAYYGTALGAIVLAGGGQLPPELVFVAGSIGGNMLSNVISDMLKDENLPADKILQRTKEAIQKSDIANLLTNQDFLHGYAHLIQRLDAQKIVSQDILNELRTGFSKVATADQVEELKHLILQLMQPLPQLAARKTRIFLSYARGDDEPFVKQLYHDLKTQGIEDIWWDRESMPNRDLTFLEAIRDAISDHDTLILVIGPKALNSDYVKAEWQYARKICVRVIPILRIGEYKDVPLELELSLRHTPDFRGNKPYKDAFGELLRLLQEPPATMGMLYGLNEEFPNAYIERTDELNSLIQKVRLISVRPEVAQAKDKVTVLYGMSGSGKTVLAQALCRQCDVRRSFSDGIFWTELGKNPPLVEQLKTIGKSLRDILGDYSTLQSAQYSLKQVLSDKKVLLVLDDVWSHEDIETFRPILGERCRLLVSTRIERIATLIDSEKIPVHGFDEHMSVQIVQKIVGQEIVDMYLDSLRKIIMLLEGHPLAISIISAQIREMGLEAIPEMYQVLIQDRDSGTPFDGIEIDGGSRKLSLEQSLELSYNNLNPELKKRFRTLGVFGYSGLFDQNAAKAVWQDERLWEANKALNDLVQFSLLTKVGERYRQHSLLHTYAHALLQRESSQEQNELQTFSQLHFAHYFSRLTSLNIEFDWETMLIDLPQYQQGFEYASESYQEELPQYVFTARAFLGSMGFHDEEERWLQRVLKYAKDSDNRDLQAQCVYFLAIHANVTHQYQLSEQYLQQGVHLSSNPYLRARIYVTQADNLYEQERWQEAVEVYEKAIGLYGSFMEPDIPQIIRESFVTDLDIDKATAQEKVMQCFIKFEQYQEALKSGLTALDIFRKANEFLMVRMIMNSIRVIRHSVGEQKFGEFWSTITSELQPIWLYSLLLPTPLPPSYLSVRESNHLYQRFHHFENLLRNNESLPKYKKIEALRLWVSLFPIEKQEIMELNFELTVLSKTQREKLWKLRPDIHQKLFLFGLLHSDDAVRDAVETLRIILSTATDSLSATTQVQNFVEENWDFLSAESTLDSLNNIFNSSEENEARFYDFMRALIILSQHSTIKSVFNWIKPLETPDVGMKRISNDLLLLIAYVFLVDSLVSPELLRRLFETNKTLLAAELEATYVIYYMILWLNDDIPSERKRHTFDRLALLRHIRSNGIENSFATQSIPSHSSEWILFLSHHLSINFSWTLLNQILSQYPEILTFEANRIIKMLTFQMRGERNVIGTTTLIMQQYLLERCNDIGTTNMINQLRDDLNSDYMVPLYSVAEGVLEFADAKSWEETRNILSTRSELLTKEAVELFGFLIQDALDTEAHDQFIQHLMQRHSFLLSCIEHGVDATFEVAEKAEKIANHYGYDLINLVQTLISLPNWQQTALMVMANPIFLEQKIQNLLDWMLQQVNNLDDDSIVTTLKKHQIFLQIFKEKGVAAALQFVMDDGEDDNR